MTQVVSCILIRLVRHLRLLRVSHLVDRIEAPIWSANLEMRPSQIVLLGLLERTSDLACIPFVVETRIALGAVLSGQTLILREVISLHQLQIRHVDLACLPMHWHVAEI